MIWGYHYFWKHPYTHLSIYFPCLNTALQFSFEALLSLPEHSMLFTELGGSSLGKIVTKKPEMFGHFGRIPLFKGLFLDNYGDIQLGGSSFGRIIFTPNHKKWTPSTAKLARLAIRLAKWLKGLLKFSDIVLQIFLQEFFGTFGKKRPTFHHQQKSKSDPVDVILYRDRIGL